MKRRKPVRISCDASVRDGYAGIAAVLEGRDVRVLFLDVAKVYTSAQGERLALEKAMTIAERAGWKHAIFRIDCRGLKVNRELLDGWTIESIPRRWNVAAHTCATQALKLWEGGCAGKPTLREPTDQTAADAVVAATA